MVHRSYKYRFYPTTAQAAQLAVEFGHSRFVWNWALDMRSKAYRRRKQSLNYVAIAGVLTKLKASRRHKWLKSAATTCLIQKLRDQDAAFKNFFDGRGEHPRFKKRLGRQSVRYSLDQRHIHRNYKPGIIIRLPKLGPIKIKWSRLPRGIPKMATVSVDSGGRYFVSISVEEPVHPLPAVDRRVGVDMGIKDVAVTSDGWKSGAPRYLRRYQRQLAIAQRRLSRKQKGSNRYQRQRRRVGRLHALINDSRTDFLHKLSNKLINENQVIGVEDLHVKGMLRNHRLANAIADSSLGELRRQLTYKADWYGRTLVMIERFAPTSKQCHVCGSVNANLSLSERKWTCAECHAVHDRDVNAAINIRNTAGSAGLNARGGWTTPEGAETCSLPTLASNETRFQIG